MKSPRKKRILFTAACSIVAAIFLVWFLCPPPLEDAEHYPGGQILRDCNGAVIRVGLGPGDVDCRPYYIATTNDWIVKALVAAEDRHFFSHNGVWLPSVARAFWQNASTMRRVSGASTLTMQAVRLIAPHPRNFFWKCVEAVKAIRLERVRTKTWILSQYLNRAPFASNLVGIEAASQGWFGRSAKDLSLAEASLLAGMVQSPSRFRPDKRMDAARKRREYVLERMLSLGMISPQEKEIAQSSPLVLKRNVRPFSNPFFADFAASRAAGKEGDLTTTLSPAIQRIVDGHVQANAKRINASCAAVVLEIPSGKLRALSCSGNYFDINAGQVNTAVAPRPAGSTLKPFILAKAFDRGLLSPSEIVADVPRVYGNFRPANFHRTFLGKVPVRDAIVLSLNIPFFDLTSKLGVNTVNETLRSLGLSTIPLAAVHGLGIAAGNVDVRLVDLANAYAAIARGGTWQAIKILENESDSPRVSVFSKGACWILSDFLGGQERSSNSLGHIADASLPRAAWKTGTSSAYRDAWTVLWSPRFVVAVWCGHKIGKFGDNTLVGSKAASPAAWSILRDIEPNANGEWFAKPKDVCARDVCEASGQPPSGLCPSVTKGIFLRSSSPSRPCSVHRLGKNGEVVEKWADDVETFLAKRRGDRLKIAYPANGSQYKWVKGMSNQAIAIRPDNVPDGEKLWWFIDGTSLGETKGCKPWLLKDVSSGEHTISCATESESASVGISIFE